MRGFCHALVAGFQSGLADFVNSVPDCLKEDLQGRQPLLTVDDLATGDGAYIVLHLLEDHGAKEMSPDIGSGRGEHPVGEAGQVVPERIPIRFLGPHIRALEERNRVLLAISKTFEMGR